MRACGLIILLVSSACVRLCRTECPSEAGQPLNLDEFSGRWYLVAGTPVSGNTLSKCGRFSVKKTSTNTFAITYTAISYVHNSPVTFIVNGKVGDDVVGNWQLVGSKKLLGPFKHIVISANYDSYIAMVVCSEDNSSYHPGHKFTMIWSRERSPPPSILGELKTRLAAHVVKGDILMVDHRNC